MIQDDDKAEVSELIQSGSEIAGGAIGGAIGLIGGPVGAIAGGALGVVATKALRSVGAEISRRVLSSREKARVGGVLAMAADGIANRLEAGEQVRNDDFFDSEQRPRSKGDEIAESILLKAQREAQEAKLPYLSNILENSAFDASLNIEKLHQLLKIFDALTYRQLVIIRVASIAGQVGLRPTDYRSTDRYESETLQILFEIYDLYQRALINFSGTALLGVSDIIPSSLRVQGLGADLYNAAGLAKIPNSDLTKVIGNLKQ